MQKRTIKMLVLTAALATATTVAVAKLQQNFSDIPAGHWASEAVQAIAAEGLITGYQDGTFQGQRTLTRYEAATIFYRLLQSGKLQQATPATQGTVQQGMAEVTTELAALKTQATETTTRLTALEEQVKTLSAPPPREPRPLPSHRNSRRASRQ
ncbi:MAG: S-layer homology domain-containing protein [Pleurocapsa sp. SU_196_0]|nr:S-layer homology domain-containing protein [Pleurocapsa sp. SU_196_0]